MKKIFYFICLVTALSITSCSNNDELVVKPTKTGTMTDKEGNQYNWVCIGKLDWMAENLKCGTPYYDQTYLDKWGDEFYSFEISNYAESRKQFKLFGNYYTYDEAVANAPEGWRLPTDEDWKALEMALGMSEGSANELGWRGGAGSLLIQTIDQGTGINLRFGGELCHFGYGFAWEVNEYHIYDYGMYWSSTLDTATTEKAAFFRKVTPSQNAVERNSALVAYRYCSVRYVRDAQ